MGEHGRFLKNANGRLWRLGKFSICLSLRRAAAPQVGTRRWGFPYADRREDAGDLHMCPAYR
jgi:hypothetical protein